MNRLVLKNIVKTFKQGSETLTILNNASLEVKVGEVIALVGPSGCGKSTLMHIAGLLDSPDGGEIIINNKNCFNLSHSEKSNIRLHEIGFIYQFHHLLNDFTALENLILPQLIAGKARKDATKIAYDLLDLMRLEHRAKHLPGELSGGEQQRIAIARALINSPTILLADEPTGNLDPETSEVIFDILLYMVKESGISSLIVTHNHTLARKASRIITLRAGKIEE
jgi:lipoprotein-releasing system ATP-binding protein